MQLILVIAVLHVLCYVHLFN